MLKAILIICCYILAIQLTPRIVDDLYTRYVRHKLSKK